MMLYVYTDGSVTGGPWGKKGTTTPIHCWCGVFIEYPDGHNAEHAVDMGEMVSGSGNVAEYGAVLFAMYTLECGTYRGDVTIRTDSQLIVRQLQGVYQCAASHLRKYRDDIWKLVPLFTSVGYEWIPREQNKKADTLSKSLWYPKSKSIGMLSLKWNA